MFVLLEWRRFPEELDMKKLKIVIILGIILFLPVSSLNLNISEAKFNIKNTNFSDTVVLVTGFGPFGNHDENPSQIIAETLNGTIINGALVVGIVLPVDFDESVENITQAIDKYNPSIVLSYGLDADAKKICIEKIGLNLRLRNYIRWVPFNLYRLDPKGPFLRLSSLPSNKIVKSIREVGIPAKQDFFAGLYICNSLLYNLLGYICNNDLQIKAGFIHVPLMSTQDPEGMDIEKMIEASEIAIQVSVSNL